MGPLEGLIPTSATKKPGWQRVLKGKGKRQPTRPEPARHTGRIAARGGCCAVARSQSLPSRPPSATAGGPVRGRQSGLRSGPRAGRQRQPRGAPRPATGEMTRGLVHRWCRPGLSPRSTSYALADACAVCGECTYGSTQRRFSWDGSPAERALVGVQTYVILPVFTLRSAHGD
jgi:hypothetical protein